MDQTFNQTFHKIVNGDKEDVDELITDILLTYSYRFGAMVLKDVIDGAYDWEAIENSTRNQAYILHEDDPTVQ